MLITPTASTSQTGHKNPRRQLYKACFNQNSNSKLSSAHVYATQTRRLPTPKPLVIILLEMLIVVCIMPLFAQQTLDLDSGPYTSAPFGIVTFCGMSVRFEKLFLSMPHSFLMCTFGTPLFSFKLA
mmetsp:Transcript_44746/g.83500  ORF Transcript_44746/g.83500 Transcript_44746/m.83500 type:complete len:126 (-) Transcript_44746:1542-1919(-)